MATAARTGGWVVGVLLLTIAGCSAVPVAGTPAPPDPRAAFGAFAHPATAADQLPDDLTVDLNEPDSRRIGSWPGTDVYLAFTAPDSICLLVVAAAGGGTSCGPAADAAITGMAVLSTEEGGTGATAAVLVPDRATVVVERGTFVAAGDGVIGIHTTRPQDGIAATLTFGDGRTSRIELAPPG